MEASVFLQQNEHNKAQQKLLQVNFQKKKKN